MSIQAYSSAESRSPFGSQAPSLSMKSDKFTRRGSGTSRRGRPRQGPQGQRRSACADTGDDLRGHVLDMDVVVTDEGLGDLSHEVTQENQIRAEVPVQGSYRLGTSGGVERSTTRAGRRAWNVPIVQVSASGLASQASAVAVAGSSAP